MTEYAEDVSNRSRITAHSWLSSKVKKYTLNAPINVKPAGGGGEVGHGVGI